MLIIKLKINSSLVIFAGVLFYLYSFNSIAMGKMGHQLVCQLAVNHLSQSNQIKLTKQLNAIPLRHKKIINKFLHRKKNASISYAQACTWADAIKSIPSFKKFNTWHYLNISRKAIKVPAKSCAKNCITQAIPFHNKQFLTNSDPWVKTQALLFMGHWYADIHQPLHVSFSSDLGGNKRKARLVSTSKIARKCDNLHWIWDECLLYLPHHQTVKQAWHDNNAQLQTLWLNTSKEQQNSWKNTPIWAMANESFELTKAPTMRYCANKNGLCITLPNKPKALPANYQVIYRPVLQERLLQAAIRLNHALTLLFNNPS